MLATVECPLDHEHRFELFALPAETQAKAFTSPLPVVNCAFGSIGGARDVVHMESLKRKAMSLTAVLNPPWTNKGWSLANEIFLALEGTGQRIVVLHGSFVPVFARRADAIATAEIVDYLGGSASKSIACWRILRA